MKAVQIDEFGSSEKLKVVDIDIPIPQKDEVLIKVEAAGVMFSDIQMREDDYTNPPKLPAVLGREVVGTAIEVGENVEHIKVGMRVGTFMHTGGYAEYAAAPAMTTFEIPDRASFLQAIVYQSSLPAAYTHYSLAGNVQPGETILIHAAAGSVGTLMTQIAKKHGNTVIALCSSEAKRQYCLTKGADYAINYRETDYVEEVLNITEGKGVDVSLNSVGGPTLETDYKAIRPLGRWVIYGYAGGRAPLSAEAIDGIMHRSQQITIASVYNYRETEKIFDVLQYCQEWLKTEPLESPTTIYALEQAAEAQEFIASQESIGKVVLVP
ncbi:quinone oxidoreductase [Maricurvus nonylphenolicus]|uniref:quinone oxidoreductase family protein n=1 Tax=Maricurvus nonylphenolicus TaxID=1008307 RepID=UPI0036F19D3B